MLTGCKFENYKAFVSGCLQLRPLTILLGANGVGKTSLLQIFQLMQQTYVASSTGYNSALKLHGRNVSMGDAESLFHQRRTKVPLSLRFEIIDEILQKELSSRLVDDFKSSIHNLYLYLAFVNRRRQDSSTQTFPAPRFSYSFLQTKTLRDTKVVLDEISTLSKNLPPEEEALLPWIPAAGRPKRNLPLSPSRLRKGDLEPSYDLLTNLEELRSSQFELGFEILYAENSGLLHVASMSLSSEGSHILGLQFADAGQVREMTSDFVDSKYLGPCASVLTQSVELQGTLFRLLRADPPAKEKMGLATLLRSIILCGLTALGRAFDEDHLHHVGPLRAYPKRFYFLDFANVASVTGDNLVELLKEDPGLLNRVNSWLRRFDIEINVVQFKELIHRLTVKQHGVDLDLDITDVGFGVSQVLPVIVQGFLAPRDSVTLIEQPEIHLHPKMQAELADLFIEMIKGEGRRSAGRRCLVVETHSEYLLKRLRRRLAEGSSISADEVAIYFVFHDAEKRMAGLERVDVPESGDFEWPKEFYAEDLADTMAFLMRQ